jgi:aspartate kinase
MIVVKVGGSVLANGEKIVKIAKSIIEEQKKGEEVVVVVSALSGETDRLLALANEISKEEKLRRQDLDDILAIGERLASRVLVATLRALGAKAKPIDPQTDEWCIFTDSEYGEANIMIEESKVIAKKKLLPLLQEGINPVVCGFIGLAPNGTVTTLGRGGSDTTAIALANMLDAERVIIVKDVEGLYSADPKRIKESKLLKTITADELRILALSGTKIINPKALEYITPKMRVKIISEKSATLDAEGTEIIYKKKEAEKEFLTQITLIGEEKLTTPENLEKIVRILKSENFSVYSILGTKGALALLVEEKDAENICELLHNLVKEDKNFKAVSIMDKSAKEFIRKDMKWLDLLSLLKKFES